MIAVPLMIRARLTDAEWAALRTLSIRTKKPAADLVAEALRQAYDLSSEKGASDARPDH